MTRLPRHVRRHGAGFRGVLTLDSRRVYGPTFRTIGEAREWVEKRLRLQIPLHVSTLTEGFAALQDELRRNGTGADTWTHYKHHARPLERILGAHTPLHAVSAEAVRRYAQARLAEGVSATTVWRSEVAGVLGRLLRLAHRRGWIAHNPLQDVQMPRTRQRPFEAMTMERIRELVGLMRQTPWRHAERDADIVTLFALTGLRRSEVARLTRESIDLALSRVWVRGKTGDGYVPITKELRPVLERLIVRSGKGPVLVGSADMLERVFARWKKQLDEPRLKPHVLRHSYATALVRSGVSLHLVRDLMRHASLQMTSRYLHSLGPEKHAAAALVSLSPPRAAGSSGEARPAPDSQDAQQAT